MAKSISRALVKKFTPLDRISDQHMDELLEFCEEVQVSVGSVALKQRETSQYKCYLIRGKIEVRRSFHERVYLDQNSEQCRKPLHELLRGSGVIRAKSNCHILKVDAEALENLLARNGGDAYQIAYLEEGETSLDFHDRAIDDNYQNDWAETFLQSPLALNLSSNSISLLFRQIEDLEVRAGEKIIAQHSSGDFFYIIKRGEARVLLDVFGPQKGEYVDLGAGGYFGDEALIAGTPRNASVIMKTDGVLGRLSRETFDAIVKNTLVSSISVAELAKLDSSRYQCIDVRFSMEYRTARSKLARNIPITHLRQRLSDFKTDMTYVVGPIGDMRSKLGTYLLRQAGFNAYCLE